MVWYHNMSLYFFILNDHLIACSLQHDSLSHMIDKTLTVWYLSVSHDCLSHDNPFFCMIAWLLVFVHYLTLDLRFFLDAPTSFTMQFRLSLSVERWEEPSPLRNPLGKWGNACVEVMTTLHGSTPSPWRHVEGCVLSEGIITFARDPLTHPFYLTEPPQPSRSA